MEKDRNNLNNIDCKQNNKIIDNLRITNDRLFSSVLQKKEILTEFIRIITNINVVVDEDNIIIKNREHTLNVDLTSKGVRFDIYLMTDKNIFDIELQNKNQYDIPYRMRYYQSILDVEHLNQGNTYKDLKTLFIIFICNFNPCTDLKSNEPIIRVNSFYTSNNKSYPYDDKVNKILINLKCNVDDIEDSDLKSFIEFMQDGYISQTKSELVDNMIKEMNKLKLDEEWRRLFMTEYEKMQEMLYDNIVEFIKIVREFELPEDSLIKKICARFNVSESEVRRLLSYVR